ncbi:MAG: CBS domain-containing protein [Planctomycetota bacterium]|jgi:CBS domain-containing protein
MTATMNERSDSLPTATPAVGARPIDDFLTGHAICVSSGTLLEELAEILEANAISGVPVIDELDRVVGVVSRTDLVRQCRSDLPDGQYLREGLTVGEVMCPEPVTAVSGEPVGVVASCRTESNNEVRTNRHQ